MSSMPHPQSLNWAHFATGLFVITASVLSSLVALRWLMM